MTTLSRRHLLGAGLALAGSTALPALAQSDKYPSRPITLVVPFPPGGSVDVMARMYSDALSRILGVPMVIENKPGAGGSIGTQYVARAKPDGYTLVVSSQSSHLANPLVQPNLGYDPIKDFANLAMLGRQPNVVVVHPSLPVNNLQELIALLKAKLGQEPRVDHPARTLEELFLATIAQASARGAAEKSGAHPSMELAPFLNRGSKAATAP